MSNYVTNLDLLSANASNKEVTANALFDAMFPGSLYGRRALTSALLTWGYYGGVDRSLTGLPVAVANGTVPLTANATNYITSLYGVVSVTTVEPAGWPGPFANDSRALFSVNTGASTALGWTDWRTMVNPRPAKRIAAPTYAAALTLDWNSYDIYHITLTGNVTFTFTGGRDGQECLLELTQDGSGSRLATFPATVRYSTGLPVPTLTTTGAKMDKLRYERNSGLDKYDLIEVVNGY